MYWFQGVAVDLPDISRHHQVQKGQGKANEEVPILLCQDVHEIGLTVVEVGSVCSVDSVGSVCSVHNDGQVRSGRETLSEVLLYLNTPHSSLR